MRIALLQDLLMKGTAALNQGKQVEKFAKEKGKIRDDTDREEKKQMRQGKAVLVNDNVRLVHDKSETTIYQEVVPNHLDYVDEDITFNKEKGVSSSSEEI